MWVDGPKRATYRWFYVVETNSHDLTSSNELLCECNTMKDADKARILLTNGGDTYAAAADVGLKNTPAPLFRLFLFSLLSSARISADIAVAASKELRRTGVTSARAAREAKRPDIIDALGRAHYVRYDERTATQIYDNGIRMKQVYQDDLRRLAEESEYSPAKATLLLTEFEGIGPVGADIFLREVQDVWPWVRPYFDKRALDGARNLGLSGDTETLSSLVPDDKLALLAAVLVRASLDDTLRDSLKSRFHQTPDP